MRKKCAITVVLTIFLVFMLLTATTSCKKKSEPTAVEYRIEVAIPSSADRAYIKEEVTFKNTSSVPLDVAVFYIYPNAVVDSVCSGGCIAIGNVSDGERDLSYKSDGCMLTVELGNTLKSGESVTLRIGATVIGKSDSRFAFSSDGALTLFRFYPSLAYLGENGFEVVAFSNVGDSFKDPFGNFELTVRTEGSLGVISGGKEVVLADGAKKYIVKNSGCIGLSVYGEAEVKSASGGGVCVKSVGGSVDVDSILGVVVAMQGVASDFPYDTLAVVFSDSDRVESCGGFIVVNEKADLSEVAFGIAKQWFGCYLRSDGYNEGWVSDALAEHLAIYLTTDDSGYRQRVIGNKSALESYRKAMAQRYGRESYDARADAVVSEYETRFSYDTVVRKGGSTMYASLVELIGAKKYAKCLSAYLKKYGCKSVTGAELVESFSKTSGVDVNGIFGAFVGGKVK